MASNLLSRMFASASGSVSVYEALRRDDEFSRHKPERDDNDSSSDIDDRNIDERFQNHDLDNLLAEVSESRTLSSSEVRLGATQVHEPSSLPTQPGGFTQRNSEDDNVPESLMLEHNITTETKNVSKSGPPNTAMLPDPVPGPSFQSSQKLRPNSRPLYPRHNAREFYSKKLRPPQAQNAFLTADPAEKAMWRWINIENLDLFLQDVYDYFLQKGIWSIVMSRILKQLVLAFVVSLLILLFSCINYQKLPGSKRLPEIIVHQCTREMSTLTSLLIWVFLIWWIYQTFFYLMDLRRLWHLHEFYTYLLGIQDQDMQTVTWQEIVGRLMNLRDANPRTALNVEPQNQTFIGNPGKQRMDAHDIANRLMRKENYLIALFNKDILNLTLPFPLLYDRQLFSKTLEWNISLCVIDLVFNDQGQVRHLFLKEDRRQDLIVTLERRFKFYALVNIMCAPALVTYFLALYFLRYFTEFQKNPAQIGSRSYTPLAEWKFREFNELSHMFRRRRDMSVPFATHYIDQFPKDKTVQLASFVAFISGALAAILAVASFLDPELFLGFEITHDRTVLFYLGVFGSIWAVARGMVPHENLVYDPEFAMKDVIHFTHYQPQQWKNRLNSEEVRFDFSKLFQTKILIFLEEILSIVFTPFVLWLSLPKSSERLIDFFREFTVHVDGLGHVCSFAVFDFQRNGFEAAGTRFELGTKDGDRPRRNSGVREDYYATKDGKMMASYHNFLTNYAPKEATTYSRIDRRNRFHLPPNFPTLYPGSTQHRDSSLDGPSERGPRTFTRHQQSHRSGMTSDDFDQKSSTASLLLDPRHRPPSTRTRVTGRAWKRLSKGDIPVEELAEQSNEDQESFSDHAILPSHSRHDEESALGESWKLSRAEGASVEKGGKEADDLERTHGNEPAGVLGLLYEFQRAQAEGVGGVTI